MITHALSRTALLVLLLLLGQSPVSAQVVWEPANEGMTGADVFAFFETARGTLLAGTASGISRMERGSQTWTRTLEHFNSSFNIYWGLLAPRSFAQGAGDTIHAWGSGKVFRSTDDGRSWELRGDASAVVTIGDGALVLFGENRRSTDEGETWEPTNLGSSWRYTSLGAGRMLAVSSRDSLFASSDAGRTWRSVAKVTSSWGVPIVVIDAMTVLRGGAEGVHRSTDAGQTWEKLWPLPTWDLARGPGGELVAAVLDVREARGTDGVHRSTDGGRTWTQIHRGAVKAVSVTSDGAIWAAGHPRIIRSSDAGATWERVESGLHERTAWVWNTGPDRFMAIARGHVLNFHSITWLRELFLSDDGGTSWRPVFDSLSTVVYDEAGSLIGVTAMTETFDARLRTERGFVSVDRGESWTGIGFGAVTDVDDNGRSTMAVSAGRIVISTDRGATWKASYGLNGTDGVAVTPSGTIFAGANGRLHRSIDAGTTWQEVFRGLTTYHIVATSDDVIAVTGLTGGLSGQGELYVTTNGGNDWVRRWFDGSPARLHADTAGNLIVYNVGSNGGHWQFASTDGGLTWSARDSAGGNNLQLGAGGDFFRFHDGRLELSTDLGVTWTTLDTGRSASQWMSAAADRSTIVATRLNDGIFRAARPSSVVALPTRGERALLPAPRPAGDALLIELTAGERIIRVVDMRGDLVLEATAEPGERTLSIDVSGLPDGLYILQRRGAAGTRTGRFVVRR